MKLLYKGNALTKAHSTDVGFDLHPESVTLVFKHAKVKITGLRDKSCDDLEKEIKSVIDDNRSVYLWNSCCQGLRKLIFDTGTAIAPPPGIWMMMCANSRVCKSQSLVMQNGVGIVDPGYRGTIKATYVYAEPNYEIEDILMLCRTCGQLIPFTTILPEAIEVEELDETERGDKGFGSSDKK